MENNENKTLEQLEAELEKARKAYEILIQDVQQKRSEEADRKKAELNAAKNARKQEIEEVENKLNALYKSYLKDYGAIEINKSTSDDTWPFFKNSFWF